MFCISCQLSTSHSYKKASKHCFNSVIAATHNRISLYVTTDAETECNVYQHELLQLIIPAIQLFNESKQYLLC